MPVKVSSGEKNIQVADWGTRILKTSIFALVFLIPLFFMPLSYGLGDFNKQVLLIILSCIGVCGWMLKTFISSKFTLRMHPIHLGVGALVVASGLSAIFSVSGYRSFWGTSQVLAPAFVSVAVAQRWMI